jgi:hypothetical protein
MGRMRRLLRYVSGLPTLRGDLALPTRLTIASRRVLTLNPAPINLQVLRSEGLHAMAAPKPFLTKVLEGPLALAASVGEYLKTLPDGLPRPERALPAK